MKELYMYADSKGKKQTGTFNPAIDPAWVQLQGWIFSDYSVSAQDNMIEVWAQKLNRVPIVRKSVKTDTYEFEDSKSKKVKVTIKKGDTVILNLVSSHSL